MMEKTGRISIFAAGSLRRALPRALNAAAIVADVVYGPAGLLAGRIAAGERPDLLLSADLGNPRALRRAGIGLEVLPWVGNRLMIVMPRRGPAARRLDALTLLKTGRNPALPLWLELLLTPGLRIGTSTLKADPGGDYAAALLAGAAKYGAAYPAVLRAKSRALVGGVVPAAGRPALSVKENLLLRRADLFLSYASNRANYPESDFRFAEIPPADQPHVRYGILVLSAAGRSAARGLLTNRAVEAMRSAGFLTSRLRTLWEDSSSAMAPRWYRRRVLM